MHAADRLVGGELFHLHTHTHTHAHTHTHTRTHTRTLQIDLVVVSYSIFESQEATRGLGWKFYEDLILQAAPGTVCDQIGRQKSCVVIIWHEPSVCLKEPYFRRFMRTSFSRPPLARCVPKQGVRNDVLSANRVSEMICCLQIVCHTSMYMHIYIHIYAYIYTYIYAYIYIYTCVYVYV